LARNQFAVVAGFAAFANTVAANRFVTGLSCLGTRVTRLNLAGGTAAIPGGRVAIIAFLFTLEQAVATLGYATEPGRVARPADLDSLAICRAAVVGLGIAVVANLFARNLTVATFDG
jgi:hypothetical protein